MWMLVLVLLTMGNGTPAPSVVAFQVESENTCRAVGEKVVSDVSKDANDHFAFKSPMKVAKYHCYKL